ARNIVRITWAADGIAKTLSKPGAVRSVLGDNLKVKVGAKIELANETYATVTLISNTRSGDWHPARRAIEGWRLSYHGVETKTLHTQLAGVKCLTGGKETAISIRAIRQSDLPVDGAQQGCRVTRAIISRMAHDLDAQLVISDLPENVAVADWQEVIRLVNATNTGQGQNALLRKQ